MESIAINVGANTNEPGFRPPVRSDGTFEFLPIPESEQTSESVPTYGDIAAELDWSIPDGVSDRPVHLDPEFAEYPHCECYTYGDNFAVKAGPLSALSAGSYVFFYATLSVAEPASWLPPTWGAFLIGQFRLARDPVTGSAYRELPREAQRVFDSNAHVKRDPFDARVLLLGDANESMLYDRVIPLSTPAGGTEPGWLVTELSEDSGKGPWWRRPLRFDAAATDRLLDMPDDPASVVEREQT